MPAARHSLLKYLWLASVLAFAGVGCVAEHNPPPNAGPRVKLSGNVLHEGVVAIRGGGADTVADVIASCGGLRDHRPFSVTVEWHRPGADDVIPFTHHLAKLSKQDREKILASIKVQDAETIKIFVPSSAPRTKSSRSDSPLPEQLAPISRVAVFGGVKQPGYVYFTEESTVWDMIETCGGPGQWWANEVIVRQTEISTEPRVYKRGSMSRAVFMQFLKTVIVRTGDILNLPEFI